MVIHEYDDHPSLLFKIIEAFEEMYAADGRGSTEACIGLTFWSGVLGAIGGGFIGVILRVLGVRNPWLPSIGVGASASALGMLYFLLKMFGFFDKPNYDLLDTEPSVPDGILLTNE